MRGLARKRDSAAIVAFAGIKSVSRQLAGTVDICRPSACFCGVLSALRRAEVCLRIAQFGDNFGQNSFRLCARAVLVGPYLLAPCGFRGVPSREGLFSGPSVKPMLGAAIGMLPKAIARHAAALKPLVQRGPPSARPPLGREACPGPLRGLPESVDRRGAARGSARHRSARATSRSSPSRSAASTTAQRYPALFASPPNAATQANPLRHALWPNLSPISLAARSALRYR